MIVGVSVTIRSQNLSNTILALNLYANLLCKIFVLTRQWSQFLATDPEVRVRFQGLPDFLRSSGSRTGPTQPREYN
jgi:hypothetical protein